eukprot:6900185-Pyramimonas_sp.AAC.1
MFVGAVQRVMYTADATCHVKAMCVGGVAARRERTCAGDTYMLSSPLRFVLTPGICSLVPCDWFQPLEYAL